MTVVLTTGHMAHWDDQEGHWVVASPRGRTLPVRPRTFRELTAAAELDTCDLEPAERDRAA